jgi:hypothetical protein
MDKDTIIVEMIDFVKCIIKDMPPEILKSNRLLSFKTELCERTGVLGKSFAYYQGLKFIVFSPTIANPTGRITFEGSLHKFFNKGRHNFNDFGVSDVIMVFKDLDLLFGISASNCVLKQLELGVNINPPISSKLVVRSCFLHGTKRFGWQSTRDEGQYIKSDCSRKTIKIYDKAIHYRKKGYKMPYEILRYEVKFKKMEILNKSGIYTLSDLVNRGLSDLAKGFLIKEWKRVLFCDEVIIKQSGYSQKYIDLNYWLNLTENNYELFKYHRGNLNKLYIENPQNMKKEIEGLISLKIDDLNPKTTEMYRLYTVYKKVVCNS